MSHVYLAGRKGQRRAAATLPAAVLPGGQVRSRLPPLRRASNGDVSSATISSFSCSYKAALAPRKQRRCQPLSSGCLPTMDNAGAPATPDLRVAAPTTCVCLPCRRERRSCDLTLAPPLSTAHSQHPASAARGGDIIYARRSLAAQARRACRRRAGAGPPRLVPNDWSAGRKGSRGCGHRACRGLTGRPGPARRPPLRSACGGAAQRRQIAPVALPVRESGPRQ